MTRSATSAAWSNLALLAVLALTLVSARVVRAQEKSWQLEAGFALYNNSYSETPNQTSAPRLTGNSFTPAGIFAQVTYRALPQFDLPFRVAVESEASIITVAGLETGWIVRDGTTYITQKENVEHATNVIGARFVYELLPFFMPYARLERNIFQTRRTDQVEGTDQGEFHPASNRDYTETVNTVVLGFGLQGLIALEENGAWRVRYELGYDVPQSVEVSNTFFGGDPWGEGTSGYNLAGRLGLDIPLSSKHDRYLTIGGSIGERTWNGDGRIGTDPFQHPYWPRNRTTIAGAFIGTGMFF